MVARLDHARDEKLLRKMIARGLTTKQIAVKLQCHGCTVSRSISRLGLEFPAPRLNRPRTVHFNRRFFRSITSQSKAYTVGFIAADGSVDRWGVRIQIHNKDKDILEKIATAVGYDGEIHYHDSGRLVMLGLYDIDVVSDLKQYGIVQRKTAILPFAKGIPDKYLFHYLRGVMDGDGSMGRQARLVTGSRLFYSQFVEWFNNTYDRDVWHRQEDNRFRLVFNQWHADFIHSLYRDARIYSDRKKDLYTLNWCHKVK